MAVFAGALAVPGFAPFQLFPATIVSLALLFYLWRLAASPRRAAWLGFGYGLGLFGGGIYWIHISLHQFGGMPWWMAAFCTFALCAFLALFPALVGALGKRLPCPDWAVVLLWAPLEWVRGWIFTGFPWLTVGYSQVPDSPLAGFMPVIGVYGVSLLVAVAARLLLDVALSSRRWLASGALLVLALTGMLLKNVEWTVPDGAPVTVALLQGNVAQDLKWQPEEIQRTLDHYFQLVSASDARLTVLPETALPLLQQQLPPDYLAALAAHARSRGGDVLYGVVERENGAYYNSMLSVGDAAPQRYRKTHLVPFGEFIPLKGLFGWIYRDWLDIPLNDLARGGFAQQPLAVAGQRVAVNICYEDVFGEEIIRQLPAATLLVNASNDAWYGDSTAAYQHLQISQARALETGRMMLRATNTGATAIIDRDGRVLAALPHFRTRILQGEAQGYRGSTPYVRFGNGLFLLMAGLALGGLLRVGKKK